MAEFIPEPVKNKTSFAGDTLKLVSGAVIGQGLTVLASPLLTRLYGPDAFGIAALFVSIMGIIGIVVCLRYDQAIMLPEKDEDAANLLFGSLGISILLSLLSIPVIWFGGPWILHLLNAPSLRPYLWTVPLTILFGGIGIGHPALNYWASRTQRYGQLSITRILGSFTTVATQLITGFAGFGSAGNLIYGYVLGSIISPMVLGWQIWREKGKFLLQSVSWQGMISGLKRYRKFPILNTWAALLNTLSTQLPTLLLSIFFSPAVVGYYALSYRLLNVPMTLLGMSIAQVFFQRASEAWNEGKLTVLVEDTFRRLIMFGTIPLLLIGLIGNDFFRVIFGSNWTEAGVYSQILAPWILVVFITSPISTLVSTLEKQEVGLVYNIVLLISRIATLALGRFLGDARTSLALFSATGVIMNLWFCFWILSAAGVSNSRTLKILGKEFLIYVPLIAVILISKLIFEIGPWQMVVIGVLVSMAFYWINLRRDRAVRSMMQRPYQKIGSVLGTYFHSMFR